MRNSHFFSAAGVVLVMTFTTLTNCSLFAGVLGGAALATAFTTLTFRASNPPAETATAPTPSKDSQLSLDAALEAAATLLEKADILTKAAQEAAAEAAKAKANAEAKKVATEKAPGMLKSKVEKEAKEAQDAADYAQARAESLAKQAAAAVALEAASKVVDAVTESDAASKTVEVLTGSTASEPAAEE